MGDWKRDLQKRFDDLAADVKSRQNVEVKGVVGTDGEERLIHHHIEPTHCGRCGLIVDVDHDCIVELRKALAFAQGNITVVRG